MIKTMIVDDDVEMLDWLEKIIEWEKHGFTITAVSKNGAEALKLCMEIMPDLIITDITMPFMDGIELLNEVKKIKPNIKCIFLTCNEVFDFAVKAIKLQVEDYIVKYTLTPSGLIELLGNFKNSFETMNNKQEEVYLLSRELSFNKIVIEEKFITDIVEHVLIRKEDILERASILKIVLPEGPFRVISTYVDNYKRSIESSTIKENNLFKSGILSLAEKIVQVDKGAKCFSLGTDKYVTLYWDDKDQIPVKQKLVQRLNSFHSLIFENLKVRLSSCISDVCENYCEIDKALKENALFRNSYFFEGSGLVITEKKSYSDDDVNSIFDEFMSCFIPALKSKDKILINQTLEWLYNKLCKRNYSPQSAKNIFKKIINELELAASKKGYIIGDSITNPDTFIAMKEIILDIVEEYLKLSKTDKLITSRKEIDIVLKYIEINISENIRCESMSSMVNMNSSYFSRLFKSEMGISFSDYLINKRIDKATELLKGSNMKIEEITKEVGLEQPSYFYKLYKKVTGKTPGEVRDKTSEKVNRLSSIS